MKRRLFISFLCIFVFVSGCATRPTQEYGVFLGINEAGCDRLSQNKLVVIDLTEFSAVKIEELHVAGKTVYGYLNISAIEEYRPYYDQFQEDVLGVYDNWMDERCLLQREQISLVQRGRA